MVMRIGLTGGIAAGKSTVARRLAELGAHVIDYDVLARDVVAPGGEGMRQIVAAFGDAAQSADGTLNRGWLAERVFAGVDAEQARRRLDAIEHPLIYRRAASLETDLLHVDAHRRDDRSGKRVDNRDDDATQAANRIVVVHDVPLLAEVIDTIPFTFDHVVTVEADESVRIERMMRDRGMTRAQAEGRVRHQASFEQRRAIADQVIDATQPIERMFERVDTLYAQWKA